MQKLHAGKPENVSWFHHEVTKGSSFSIPLHGHKWSTSSYPRPGCSWRHRPQTASKAHIDQTFTRSTCCFIGKPGFPLSRVLLQPLTSVMQKTCADVMCRWASICISTSILHMRTNIVQQYLKYIGDR